MPPPASCTTLLLELAGETMSSPRDSAQAWKRDRSAADLAGAEAACLEPSHRFLKLVQLAPLTAVEGCDEIAHNPPRRVFDERHGRAPSQGDAQSCLIQTLAPL